MRISTLLMLGLIPGLILIGTCSGASPDMINRNVVEQDQAYQFAKIVLADFILEGSPGAESAWTDTSINPTPLEIYDIDGNKVFYDFYVNKGDQNFGAIRISANKLLRTTYCSIETSPRKWNLSEEINKGLNQLQSENNNVVIAFHRVVSYNYPTLGLEFTLTSEKKESRTKVIEIVTHEEPDIENIHSLLSVIANDDADQNIANWEMSSSNLSNFETKMASLNIDIQKPLNSLDVQTFNKEFSLLDTQKFIPLTQYYQANETWCVPATGQMIAKYYAYSHAQSQIASWMNTTEGGTPVGNSTYGELHYYISHINKPNSGVSAPTWSFVVNEINANRPFDSRTNDGWGFKHARACSGYWDTALEDSQYIYDPLPGNTRWEVWGFYYIINGMSVYVR